MARRSQRFDLRTHDRPFVSVPDLADYLDVTERTVRRMIEIKALPAVKVGRLYRIPTDAARKALQHEQSSNI